jgi:hypothetical protein
MSAPPQAVVFLGPTLSHRDASDILDAHYLPPARQGDVLRAVRALRPRCIGLIDGLFLDVAAVWHRELLWALAERVHVFGAASMGALRAAELEAFGMRGIGRIAAAYREARWPDCDEPFEDDDEVAVIHAPLEMGGAPLSDAMVDLRDTLLAAEAAAVIDRAQRDALIAAMKRLHFSTRSVGRLAEAAHANGAGALVDWLPSGRVQRKRLDAVEMLHAMAAFLATDPPPFQPAFRFERALVWERFIAECDAPECDALDADESVVLDELRIDPVAWRAAVHAAIGRRQAVGDVASGPLQAQFDRFRRERGLWQRAELDAWLADNALDAAGLERLLRHETTLDATASRAGGSLGKAIVDHLRITDRFASLLRRARAKEAATAAMPPQPRGPHQQALLEWYFEQRLGRPTPAAVGTFAVEAGWRGEAEFILAVWREHLFKKIQE